MIQTLDLRWDIDIGGQTGAGIARPILRTAPPCGFVFSVRSGISASGFPVNMMITPLAL